MNELSATTLTFIAERRQWAAAREQGLPEAADVVVTASPEIYFECRLQGRPCLSLWDYLPVAESVRHEQWVWDWCGRIGRALREREGDGGLSGLIAYDAFHALVAVLNLACSASRLLAERRPARVRVFSEMQQPLLWDASTPDADLFNFVVDRLARGGGREMLFLSLTPAVREEIRLADVPPCIPEPDAEAALPSDPVRALVFTQSISWAEQEPLLPVLHREWGGGLVTVMPEPADIRGPYLSWSHLRRLPIRPPPMPDEPAMQAALADAVSDPALPEYVRILAGPECAAFFLRGWRDWLALASAERGIVRLCHRAYRPGVAVLPYDIEGTVRSMAFEWAGAGVPTLAVDHVGLALPCVGPRSLGAGNAIAVWGGPDAALHSRWRDPSARVFQTGSMRRDLAAAAERGRMRAAAPASPDRPAVLIITAQYGSELMVNGGYPAPGEALSWWTELARLSVRNLNWDWKLKKHPRFDHESFYRYLAATVENRFEPATPDLLEALDSADVMLLMANASTSAAHAILAGVPVVYFKPPVTPEFWRSPLEDGGAVVVSDMPSLEAALQRMLADAAYRREVAAAQRAVLDQALVATGDASVNLVRNAIEELRRDGPAPAAPDPAARWIADMTMTVDHGLRGAWPWRAFRRRLRQLAARGRKLAFDDLDFLDADRLPDYFMNIALLSIWRRPEADRRISRRRPWLGRILWEIRRALPDSIRPPAGWLRPYLRRTVEEEAALNPASRFWNALRRRTAAA
ncbi:MAG TPA: hypothetical protein P5567_03410 [Kiritimatiellia bacterium]|nr:hypothetical protein [Kiritimatiellia bacterium]HRZ11483.1 hypothetical protein [Kiritimatiellia bacterium]HSA16966.1 hypothetical protein [Kiritimatiellia bacterium]